MKSLVFSVALLCAAVEITISDVITHVTIKTGAIEYAGFQDFAKWGPGGGERGKLTFTLSHGDKECGCSTSNINSKGFVIDEDQLYDYDVDIDCPDFQIRDICDVTNFRIETNSGNAAMFSYVALIVNGMEFRVDDNDTTPFQVKSQNPNKSHRREGAVVSKDYPLDCGVVGEPAICKNGQCKITHVTIKTSTEEYAGFQDYPKWGPGGDERGKLTFTLLNGDKECGCSTSNINSKGFVIDEDQLYDYDVDIDCPDFQIRHDASDVTHLRIETNSGNAAVLSYVALIVNGIEFRVDDNGETPFQVKSQNPNKKHRREGAVVSKDYAL